ncbi:conjugal transfer protein TraD [Labrys sp. ZIDIC5]|uniref:conjugal transfer protein TraD n=1 Tax=Labrys sedimenti TaxID=3106036 RepID=UPI002ACA725C|nr:conjugal transfer protein TraD [Labrys sp. ZIDIC5]MDZ5454730.1 conjugal transfer protein TraD [Labrys sp. ZIDIC5]
MRTWQVERRRRTRHLIELGGLIVKAGIVELTADDRVVIYGALLWMADKLKSEQGQQARMLWTKKGKEAFAARQKEETLITAQEHHDRLRRPCYGHRSKAINHCIGLARASSLLSGSIVHTGY